MTSVVSGPVPSMDDWLREAKLSPVGGECGMFLVHNGVVRESSRAKVRFGADDGRVVNGMRFSFNLGLVEKGVEETNRLDGIFFVKVWLNEGLLGIGDDVMFVMVGGDIRPRVIGALEFLVGFLKEDCVVESEVLE